MAPDEEEPSDLFVKLEAARAAMKDSQKMTAELEKKMIQLRDSGDLGGGIYVWLCYHSNGELQLDNCKKPQFSIALLC